MEKDFTMLSVGKVFDAVELPDIRKQTGAYFGPVEGMGYMLILHMPNMSPMEAKLISESKIQFRVFKETDSFMLALARFGNSELMYEIAIDPTNFEEIDIMSLCLDSNMMAIIALESNDKTIKAIRFGNMPNGLRQKFIATWNNALQQHDFSAKYKRWIADLWGRYSTVKLWDRASYVGRLGE